MTAIATTVATLLMRLQQPLRWEPTPRNTGQIAFARDITGLTHTVSAAPLVAIGTARGLLVTIC
jgi:hypothetical protein